jgi:steroid delta-isomerase-like uncharacterized protein
MTEREEVNAVMDKMVGHMNEHDLEACVACYSEDAELQDPRFPDPVHGKDYVRQGFKYWYDAFPDVKIVVLNKIIDGPKVALEWTFEATHLGEYLGVQGSGRKFLVLAAAHFEVRGGKVTRDLSLFDASALRMLETLAAEAAPPARQ